MHAYFLTRGIKQDVELWTKFMETQFLPMPFKDKDGKDKVVQIQGALRPIQMWEYVFPENNRDIVLTTLGFDKPLHPNTLKMKMGVEVLRKALGASKIPKFDTSKKLTMPPLWVNVVPIGIKKDKQNVIFPDGKVHEFL